MKAPGQAIDSIVSGGAILSGGTVRNSVIGRGVHVLSGALVEDSIMFDNCVIGRRSRVRRAILDKNVHVPEDASIGYDLARIADSTTSPKAASWWWKGTGPRSTSRPCFYKALAPPAFQPARPVLVIRIAINPVIPRSEAIRGICFCDFFFEICELLQRTCFHPRLRYNERRRQLALPAKFSVPRSGA